MSRAYAAALRERGLDAVAAGQSARGAAARFGVRLATASRRDGSSMHTLRICWGWCPLTAICPWQRCSAASSRSAGCEPGSARFWPSSESGWPHWPT